jgi:hypothetical protein
VSVKTFTLKLLSAIVVAGEVITRGSLVELAESEAKHLLSRGKARLATEDDAVAVVKQPAPEAAAPSLPEKPATPAAPAAEATAEADTPKDAQRAAQGVDSTIATTDQAAA